METLLAIGNTMNEGARAEIADAGGFTVESLLRLSETRATQGPRRITVLDYFVTMVAQRGEGELLAFPEQDTPTIAEAAKLPEASTLTAQLRTLRLELRKVLCCGSCAVGVGTGRWDHGMAWGSQSEARAGARRSGRSSTSGSSSR